MFSFTVRLSAGLALLVGLGVIGSPSVSAQQAQCTSGTCPRAAGATTYTYQRQAPATVSYGYQYRAPAAVQYTAAAPTYQYQYQYQTAATTQYQYQYQYRAATTTQYQYQAAAPTYQYQAAPAQYQYQQAAGTVQYRSYYHAAGTASTGGGDPYGFLSWLNSTRASYGLSAVGYDANLESWAASNNGHQQSRGLGHYVMGSARRQNSAMGSYSSIGSMWMNSPAHRAALLDPTITRIGLAGSGSYWTFNAN